MKGFLVDTNVLSELRRPRCNVSVADFALSQPDRLMFTTELNIAEIRFGRDLMQDALRQREIDVWLETSIRPWFSGRILPLTEDAVVTWRHIVEKGRSSGYTFPEPDTLIAAIAIEHELIVVTRDTSPYVKAGTDVLDPWSGRFISASGRTHDSASLANPALLQILESFL